jgi:hypothetical protein
MEQIDVAIAMQQCGKHVSAAKDTDNRGCSVFYVVHAGVIKRDPVGQASQSTVGD